MAVWTKIGALKGTGKSTENAKPDAQSRSLSDLNPELPLTIFLLVLGLWLF